MINKIAHLADIHVPKRVTRHEEYYIVFDNLFKDLKSRDIDAIFIVGDIVHDFIDLQSEQIVLVSYLLNGLADIAKTYVSRGNHDILKKNIKRLDAVEAIIQSINNPNITYLNETGFHEVDNLVLAVWKHGESDNNPWKKRHKRNPDKTYIDIFHDPINGSITPNGYEMKKPTNIGIKEMRGDYGFFGDIHLQQFVDKNNKKGYPSSLICQNYSEGDGKFHGYILWDIDQGTHDLIPIYNPYSFSHAYVNEFTDFDDLDFEIKGIGKYPRIKVVWNCLPSLKTRENEIKVREYLKENYNAISIPFKEEFIVDPNIEIIEEIDLDNILLPDKQEEIFTNHCQNIGLDEVLIDEIIKLDREITGHIDVDAFTSIEWDIVKVKADNFMSYDSFEIDYKDKSGLFQVTGENAAGKTTFLTKVITYALFNTTEETKSRMKFGDQRFVNFNTDKDYCEVDIVIEATGNYYGVRRRTQITRNKSKEINGINANVFYFKLNNPDDPFDENNIVDDNTNIGKKTQEDIERIIGTYKNFTRIVSTTSDSLNDILSNDESVFMDSLMIDAGLDIFEKKSKAFKEYKKQINLAKRISIDVDQSKEQISQYENEIKEHIQNIEEYENVKIVNLEDKIERVENKISEEYNSKRPVKPEISSLDLPALKREKQNYIDDKDECQIKIDKLQQHIDQYQDNYDRDAHQTLKDEKDKLKQQEYNIKQINKDIEHDIAIKQTNITRINGVIESLRDQYKLKQKEYQKTQNDTHCPTCKQLLDDSHQEHINNRLSEITVEMSNIKAKADIEKTSINPIQLEIEKLKGDKEKNEKLIHDLNNSNDELLIKLGEFSKLENEHIAHQESLNKISQHNLLLNQLTTKIENCDRLEKEYYESEENIKLNNEVDQNISKLNIIKKQLQDKRDEYKEEINYQRNFIGQKKQSINTLNENIKEYLEQEKRDEIFSVYEKCVHRKGIPEYLLQTSVYPRINDELCKLLEDVEFKVWLDAENNRVKFAYNDNLDNPIDAISSSGKERTFASIALKFALNQINKKSKPKILLLDEVMGKLINDSVDEFIELLNKIKNRVNKFFIIEHNHNVNPDYVIAVKNENKISSFEII